MHRSLRLSLVAVLLAAPLLAACGDDDDGGATPTTAGGGEPSSTLTVHAKDDLTFDKTSYTAEAGTVEFTYVNDGSTAHTLLIEGVDKSDFYLEVGGEDEGSVSLEPGDYLLYCDVAGHQAAGMEADLTVS